MVDLSIVFCMFTEGCLLPSCSPTQWTTLGITLSCHISKTSLGRSRLCAWRFHYIPNTCIYDCILSYMIMIYKHTVIISNTIKYWANVQTINPRDFQIKFGPWRLSCFLFFIMSDLTEHAPLTSYRRQLSPPSLTSRLSWRLVKRSRAQSADMFRWVNCPCNTGEKIQLTSKSWLYIYIFIYGYMAFELTVWHRKMMLEKQPLEISWCSCTTSKSSMNRLTFDLGHFLTLVRCKFVQWSKTVSWYMIFVSIYIYIYSVIHMCICK